MKITSRIHLSNHTLKALSIIFGYTLWLIFAQANRINISYDIPIAFYGLSESLSVDSQDTVFAHITGKRSDLSKINISQPAVHIDLSYIKDPGNYEINLSENQFFLRNEIKLLNYFPSKLIIRVKSK